MQAESSEEYAIFPASHLLDSTSVHSGNDALYTPLTTRQHEFRLIEILPQIKDNARIQVRATIRDLQSAAGTYTALSYTWGRPDTACTIELNGRAVNIRKNLWRFLHQARCSASLSGKLFWVDSLSIDQTNEAERSHQVGLMAQIYCQAEQVLVWLGPAYDNSSAAMKALKWHAKKKSIVRDIWWKTEATALRGICERIYWTRLWVLQELALAKKAIVMCGPDSISWSTFEAFFVNAQRHTPKCRQVVNMPHLHATQSRAIVMMERVVAVQQKATLYNQMLASKHFGCADLKDKVYALLGVVQLGQDAIVPDYSADMSSLLNTVLRNEHKRRSVEDLSDVITQCEALAEAVGVHPQIIYDVGDLVSMEQSHNDPKRSSIEDDSGATDSFLENDICASVTGVERSPFEDESGVSILWALKYRHDVVGRLWLKKNGWPVFEAALRHAIFTGCKTAWQMILDYGEVSAERARRAAEHAAELAVRYPYHYGDGVDSPEEDAAPPDFPDITLTTAAAYGREDRVRMLLRGAKRSGTRSEMALTVAAAFGHEGIVKMLLSHERIDVAKWTEWSPLNAAIVRGHVSVARMVAQHIRDAPAGFKHKLVLNGINLALKHERLDALSPLLEQLDYTELASGDGFTAYQHTLLRGVRRHEQEFLSQMLTALDLEALHRGGRGMRNVFMEAARLAEWTIVLQLLQKVGFGEADFDSAALVLAVEDGPEELVEHLLNLPYLEVNTVTQFLRHGQRSQTALSQALQRGSSRVAELLLSKSHSTIDTGNGKWILLSYLRWAFTQPEAVENGALKAILVSGLNAYINWNDLEEKSALCIAASQGHLYLVDLLLKQGLVDVNRRSSIGDRILDQDTALRWAIRGGHTAVVQRLLSEPDIDVNLRCHGPGTLALAHGEIAELLLQRDDIECDATIIDSPIAPSSWSRYMK